MAFKMHKFAFIPFLLMVFLVLILICCKPGAEPPEIQNLRAFAKLYGYIRYFHPSDEASRIDWNRFVIYGVEKVNNAKDQQELKYLLEELFLPLAPTIQIFNTGEKPAKPKVQPLEDTTGLKVVIWQHRGLGSGLMNSPYLSIRLNKENILKAAFSGVLTQGVDATLLRGKEIKLTASVRAQVQGMGNQGHLLLKVDRENKQRGFLDSMNDRPIRSNFRKISCCRRCGE